MTHTHTHTHTHTQHELRQHDNCPICRSISVLKISFTKAQSMRSDGLVLNEPLKKFHCESCGLLFGRNSQPKTRYQRSTGTSVFDIARHQSVAEGLARYIMKFSNKEDLGILEVGAASFRTALFLKKIKPSYVISALEQYPEQIPATKDISVILNDFFDFQPQEKFDVCYSNQVMEHFDDPIQFLRQSSKVIRDEGLIIVCCPTSTKASNELLFSDHISHFTETAMKECALHANLEVIDSDICDWDSLTHIYAMTKKAAATSAVTRATSNFEGLLENRTRLLDAWLNEDSRMCEILRDVDSIVIYGAGEFTQLIRAYLPEVWTKVEKLVVDNLEGIRAFDRPVYHIDEIKADDRNAFYLIGAHKQSRSTIMKKLLERKIKEENIFSLEV